MFNLRNWRPRQLMASWCVYWVGLIGVTLGKALVAISRATGAAEGRGSVALSFDNARMSLTAIRDGATLWTGTASMLTIAVALAGPPLAIWLLWLRERGQAPLPKREAALLNAADPLEQRTRSSQRAHPDIPE